MSLTDDMKPYFDSETGLYTAPDGGKDNEPLVAATMLVLHAGPTSEAMDLIARIGKFTVNSTVAPGRYMPRPGNPGQNSVDNYIALSTLHGVAADIEKSSGLLWNFNTVSPSKLTLRSWFGRFIGFSSFVRVMADKERVFDKPLLGLGMIASLFSYYQNTSNKCLQALMISSLYDIDRPKLALKIWQWRMRRQYPGGYSELLSIYWGATHPFVKRAPKDWSI